MATRLGGPSGYQEVPSGPGKRLPTSERVSPSLSDLSPVPGYEGLTFNDACQTPPNREPVNQVVQETGSTEQSVPHLTEEDVREALLSFVDQNCCYGRRAARNLRINDILHRSATHYTLETFGERRSAAWTYEPYGGQPLQSNGGPAPLPWDIALANPQGPFTNATVTMEVPNTAQVHVCHRCVGLGQVLCEPCNGLGNTLCSRCTGQGTYRTPQQDRRPCDLCAGTGHECCARCTGDGQIQCKVCCGLRQLKYFIRLTVTWFNHVGNNVSDTGQFPRELILDAQGKTVYEVQRPRVSPITHLPGTFVQAASTSLILKHSSSFTDERIVQQKHRVRMVPVVEVHYTWEQKDGVFHVYSFDNKVHFPDYPHVCYCCCCGCQLL